MTVYRLIAVLTPATQGGPERLLTLGDYPTLAAAQACCTACEADGIDGLDHCYIGSYELTDAE